MASFLMSTREINSFGGTVPYMAPELIHPFQFGLKRSELSKEGDVYAIGMVVYEIVTGVRPFGLENFREQQMVYAVLDGMRPEKPENAEAIGFGREVWDLVERCWGEDWKQRPKTWDVRQRLTTAAALSSSVPPGPMIALPPALDLSTRSK
jgi:serine/threonine protein kinase